MARPVREADRVRFVSTVLPETKAALDLLSQEDRSSYGKVIDKVIAEYMKDHKEVEEHK